MECKKICRPKAGLDGKSASGQEKLLVIDDRPTLHYTKEQYGGAESAKRAAETYSSGNGIGCRVLASAARQSANEDLQQSMD